tara:strand:+ start:211 stop:429 length:219 start_codon:yes stop_codon:yes gene_type:complete
MSDNKRYLTTKQAAEYLGLHPQTLSNWRSSGLVRIPFCRLGRKHVIYEIDALDAFIASNMVSSTSETRTAAE